MLKSADILLPLDIARPDVGARVEVRDGRLWVCVDGECVLRVIGCKVIEVEDFRERE